MKISEELDDVFGRSWSLRNLALDTLESGTEGEERNKSLELLEQSLELAREAGQPENLMHSLRSLIHWRMELDRRKPVILKLIEELETEAAKVSSQQFIKFCKEIRTSLGKAMN